MAMEMAMATIKIIKQGNRKRASKGGLQCIRRLQASYCYPSLVGAGIYTQNQGGCQCPPTLQFQARIPRQQSSALRNVFGAEDRGLACIRQLHNPNQK